MPRSTILRFIDFFYPPFRRFMPIQTFRYAVCGGSNTVLGLVVYAWAFQNILKGADLDLGFYVFKGHVAALMISFMVNLPVGFILNKYVVFSESTLKSRIQLFRYIIFFVFCLFLNYVLLKFLVEVIHWHAIFSQCITTAVVIVVSYLTQKHFTFKVEKDREFPF